MKVGALGLRYIALAGIAICGFLPGCMGSGVYTPIHQTETSRVYLEWVPQDSFRASHPATLPPTVIHGVLRGLRVEKPKAVFGELVTGQQKKAKRVFSDEDVELLTPHILSALSQATPEEQVVFQRIYPWEYGSRITAGALFLHEDLLFLTITHYTQKPRRINFVYVDDRQAPDPTGLGDRTVLFIPKEALRPDTSPQEPRHPHEVTLAINYTLLETRQEPGEQPASSQIRQIGIPSHADSRDGDVAPTTQEAAHGESASEDPAIRALEEQVHKQKQELEQLKKKLQEIQRSRDSERQPR